MELVRILIEDYQFRLDHLWVSPGRLREVHLLPVHGLPPQAEIVRLVNWYEHQEAVTRMKHFLDMISDNSLKAYLMSRDIGNSSRVSEERIDTASSRSSSSCCETPLSQTTRRTFLRSAQPTCGV